MELGQSQRVQASVTNTNVHVVNPGEQNALIISQADGQALTMETLQHFQKRCTELQSENDALIAQIEILMDFILKLDWSTADNIPDALTKHCKINESHEATISDCKLVGRSVNGYKHGLQVLKLPSNKGEGTINYLQHKPHGCQHIRYGPQFEENQFSFTQWFQQGKNSGSYFKVTPEHGVMSLLVNPENMGVSVTVVEKPNQSGSVYQVKNGYEIMLNLHSKMVRVSHYVASQLKTSWRGNLEITSSGPAQHPQTLRVTNN